MLGVLIIITRDDEERNNRTGRFYRMARVFVNNAVAFSGVRSWNADCHAPQVSERITGILMQSTPG